jgi:hypothetical protein
MEDQQDENRIFLDCLVYTPHPKPPYHNPLLVRNVEDIFSNEIFSKAFEFYDNLLNKTQTLKNMGIHLSQGYVSRFAVRDWGSNFDLQFELFKRIEGTDEFLFFQLVCNTGELSDNFTKKLYKLLCFKLNLLNSPDEDLVEEALEKVDDGKWKDWKIKEFEKAFGVFSYTLTNPQQESCVLKIEKDGSEKRVIIAYTVEENDREVFPAVLIEL